MVQLLHPYMTTGKTIALTRQTGVGKVMSLLFNMLSRLAIAFLPRSKHLSVSWLQSPSAVILEPKKIKSVTVAIVSPSICHKVMGLDALVLVFWIFSFKSTFSLSSFTFIRRLFTSSSLYDVRVEPSSYLRLLIFLLQSWFHLVLHPAQHFTWCNLHNFANKGLFGQGYGFSSGHVWMWELDSEESWAPKNDAFELWCWRRLLRAPWTAKRSNQSILKQISPECSLEGLMLKLKLQYLGHLMQRSNSFEKTLVLGKIEGKRRMGWQRMRWLDGITNSMEMSLSKL